MPKNLSKKKTDAKDDINYKKLFFELMIVLSVIFAGAVAILYPYLKEHGAFRDTTYDIFDSILEEVDNYDYSKGRDLELEKRLDEAWHNDTNPNKKYYYGIASATYYCNIGFYNTSQGIFYELYEIVPNGTKPHYDLEVRDVLCDRRNAKEMEENK